MHRDHTYPDVLPGRGLFPVTLPNPSSQNLLRHDGPGIPRFGAFYEQVPDGDHGLGSDQWGQARAAV